jgi:hypothetical protein
VKCIRALIREEHHSIELLSTEERAHNFSFSQRRCSSLNVFHINTIMGWVPENTPPQQDDSLTGETGGFQWLTMSSSTISDAEQPQEVPLEKKNTNGSVAISNRSWHSDGSGNDDDDRNPSSPWRRRQHNTSNRSRLRSRSQSPTTTMLTSPTTRRGKSPSTPTHSLSSSDDGDYKIKNARDVLEGSISAVINFLKSAGVPKPRYVVVVVVV